ncbi:ATP-binding protein [Halobaculum limi]|uniref:ATP-binding protein n=1 Tax=Halobaculum limi TaxID=3031916 RepID=UPI002406B02F|nr:ATP-binding protein [Halobaculum sp. YSMS11]
MTDNDTDETRSSEQAFETLRGDFRALYDYIEEQATKNVAQVAYSTDGRTFDYEAPLSLPAPIGSYVRLQTTDNREYLGQVTTKAVVKRKGPELGFELGDEQRAFVPEGMSLAAVTNQLRVLTLEGSGVLLGRVTDDAIRGTTNTDTFRNATVDLAQPDVVNRYLGGSERTASLPVARALYVDGSAPVHLDAGGFNRHTFLCGQSGSGKTFSLGIVLEQLLLETDLRVVIIDPNSDFVRLNRLRPREEVNRFRSEPLSAAAYDRLAERYREATTGLRVFRPASVAAADEEPLRVRFGDLSQSEQATVLQLDPLDDRAEFNAFRQVVERLGDREYSWEDVREAIAHDYTAEARQLGLRIQNLDLADWDVWCSPGDPSLTDTLDGDDWRCLVVDIGTLGSPSEKSVVANAVLTHLWHDRTRRRPTLVVVDEAHNVCPADPTDDLVATSAATVDRIAAEGRKFGLYLLLSTQRPGKIHDNVLSQCSNLVLMRMNSQADLDHLSAAFSQVPASLLAEANKFDLGETVLAGRIVQNPTVAAFEGRLSEEGGSDVPTTWARRRA